MIRLLGVVLAVLVVGCSAPSPQSDAGTDAGTDAGAPVATQSIGTTGGTLALENLRLTLPSGATTATLALEVKRTDETPTLSGVTPLTPVFDFGPDGTQFASEVAVEFTVTPAPTGADLPIVFWTQADGSYAPLPTWWGADGKVHALTTHLSKAFVGKVAVVPDSLLCCGGQACAGRGVCLVREPIAENKVTVDGQQFGTSGVYGRTLAVNTPRVPRTATLRKTPVRPFELGLPSTGAVLDLSLSPFEVGEQAELCFDVQGSVPLEGTCLASFDEGTSKWKCEDKCLDEKGGQLCGTTSHFTSFAVLLSGGSSNTECGR